MTTKRALYGCAANHEFVVQLDASDQILDGIRCRHDKCRAKANYSRVLYEPPNGWNDEPEADAPYVFVKGRDYALNDKFKVMPQGRHYGVSDAAHEAAHRRRGEEFAKQARAFKRSRSRRSENQPEFLGSMPAELMHQISMQEGDPSAVTKDPVGFLKKTGRYVGS